MPKRAVEHQYAIRSRNAISVGRIEDVAYTLPGRFDFGKFFGKWKNKRADVLHVGLGMESPQRMHVGPISLFEIAALSKGRVYGIDILKEPVEEARRIMKTGRITISKRVMEESMFREGMQRSPLFKFSREQGDFIIIDLPKQITDRVTVEQADMTLSRPLRKADVVLATNVLQYVDPVSTFLSGISGSVKKGGHVILDDATSARIGDHHMKNVGFKPMELKNQDLLGDSHSMDNKLRILKKVEDIDDEEILTKTSSIGAQVNSPPGYWYEYELLCRRMGVPKWAAENMEVWSIPPNLAGEAEIRKFEENFKQLEDQLKGHPGVLKELKLRKSRYGRGLSQHGRISKDDWDHFNKHFTSQMKEIKHFALLLEKKRALNKETQEVLDSAPHPAKEKLRLAVESRDYTLIEKYLKLARDAMV